METKNGKTATGRTSKGEQTKSRLRKSAAATFARRGYHDTKVSDIVRERGLSQPTFYSYFTSKEAAYNELVGEFRDRLKALTRTLLIEAEIAPDAVIERVGLSVRKILDFLAEDPDLTEIGFFQPPACVVTKAELARWIAENIVKEQYNLLFRHDIAADQIGRLFVGMIEALARGPVTEEERARNARDCALLICEGLWLKP
ncbi:TetR/AcrR family transcriptional regulator [Agrobacterium rhizogenes]|uniref:TetR/AcrR family transcriptional regulator n=1 Tax=Rhizobium rhizogenes TaxID=359 RepID=UPI0015748A25|nr:TetR/AcrR family transcriptional regulator [Rhizobium rhizogenes]NTI63750.1 TetR/AcrR family transcriptional regulator [Rhizobium rhizogenes]